MNPDDETRMESLCPALRRIVDAEVRSGNWIAETWKAWGFVVLLGRPFDREHDLAGGELEFREVNDPHYWKSEYECKTHAQSVACLF